MTPAPGMGAKSTRTEALELRKMGWRPERIAEALDTELKKVQEWIYGKPRKPTSRRSGISECSPAQRKKVKGRACIRCRQQPCDPVHLIPKSLASDDDGDPRAVIPACRECHRNYDEGGLSLLEFLEPHWREELAYAVERVGLLFALERITNEHWVSEKVPA